MRTEVTTREPDGKSYSEKQLSKGNVPDGIYSNGYSYIVVDGSDVVGLGNMGFFTTKWMTETDEEYVRIPDGQTVTIKLTQEPTDETES